MLCLVVWLGYCPPRITVSPILQQAQRDGQCAYTGNPALCTLELKYQGCALKIMGPKHTSAQVTEEYDSTRRPPLRLPAREYCLLQ